jgi:uncharacterized protein (UPF0303 family)
MTMEGKPVACTTWERKTNGAFNFLKSSLKCAMMMKREKKINKRKAININTNIKEKQTMPP